MKNNDESPFLLRNPTSASTFFLHKVVVRRKRNGGVHSDNMVM